ncbi:hypothetical protein N9D09_00930 [bacterium]|nr:hypothetical protein [bacterium]
MINPSGSYAAMKAYNEMPGGMFPPYLMLQNPSNYKSDVISTDEYGVRLSSYKDSFIGVNEASNFDFVNLVVGASTAFGVGSSSDNKTLSSVLSVFNNEPWLNLGIRGCNSFQEIIHLTHLIGRLPRIKNMIILSGINDLYRNVMDSEISNYDKRFGYQNDYLSMYSPRKIAQCYFISLLSNKTVREVLESDWKRDTKKVGDYDADSVKKNLSYICNRNFKIYSNFKYAQKVTFVLQPFASISKDQFTHNETQAFANTEKLQRNTNWLTHKDRLISLHKYYKDLLINAAKDNCIALYDANEWFGDDLDLFVDHVHLTDLGYYKIAEKLNEKVLTIS